MNDGDRTNLLGETAGEGGIHGLRSGGHNGVDSGALSEPSRRELGGLGRGTLPSLPPHPPESQTYQVSFPKRLLRLRCPVEGCLGGASN